MRGPLRSGRRGGLAVPVAAFLVLVAVGAALFQPEQKAPEPANGGEAAPVSEKREVQVSQARPVLEPVRRDIRVVTPRDVTPAPRVEAETIVRLPAVQPPPPPQRPPQPVIWKRALVEDAGRLRSGGTILVLAKIEALAGDALCRDAAGKAWPCGRFSRAALQRLVRQRSIECEPAERAGAQLVTSCRIDGRDIGLWLVEQGWARAAPGSAHAAAEEAARAQGRGQWARQAPGGISDGEPG
jgi:endonuclease YncB( thermonuclease family)